jgi:hypothetical protein
MNYNSNLVVQLQLPKPALVNSCVPKFTYTLDIAQAFVVQWAQDSFNQLWFSYNPR